MTTNIELEIRIVCYCLQAIIRWAQAGAKLMADITRF